MAIIDDLPGVVIEIIVKGTALKEYEDDELDEDERTVTRYIEAVSGQEFAVRIKRLPNCEFKGDCISFTITADGQDVDFPLLSKTKGRHTHLSEGKEEAGGYERKYRFADLETVNDGKIKNDEVKRVKALGTLRIECTHALLLRKDTLDDSLKAIDGASIVSEKAVKGRAITHSIEFSNPKKMTTGASNIWKCRLVEGEPDPAAVFVFCYRSLAALKSMLIIPRTPTPPPLEERDFATFSADELKELKKKFLELKSQNESRIKVKREKVDDNPRPRKVARPSAGDTQLELDDDGNVRDSSTPTFADEKVVIEID